MEEKSMRGRARSSWTWSALSSDSLCTLIPTELATSSVAAATCISWIREKWLARNMEMKVHDNSRAIPVKELSLHSIPANKDSHGSKACSLHFRNLYYEASRILQYCTKYMFILLSTISSIMHTNALEAFSIPTRRKHSQSRWQEGKLTCNLRHCWTTCSNSLSSCTHRTVCKKLETREKEGPNKTKWLEHHHRFCSKSHSCISQQTCKFPQDSKTTYDIPSFYKIQSICSCHEASKIQPSPLTTCHLHQLLSYLCTNAISLSTLQFR